MPDLAAYLDRVRAAHGEVPGFDPAGPGAGARLLILLETPGPRIGLTGVVSLANPAGTARNLRRFLAEAGIDIDAITAQLGALRDVVAGFGEDES